MMIINKSIVIKDDLFQVILKNMTAQKRKSLLNKSLKYSYLKNNEEFLVMEVLSKNKKSEIILSPNEIEEVVNHSIESLIEEELYEQCIVLKDIKDTFKNHYTNDN